MRFFQTTILFLLLLITGCSESNEDIIQPDESEEGLGGLVIGVSQVASTRTAIDSSDNESVTWCVGDQIALWADGTDDGQAYISGEMFQLRYYGSAFNVAEFASSSTSSMASGKQYNYVGFYPHSKATISGKSVSYTIPSTQYGEYDGEYDYRIADSATGSALSLTADSDCKLSFRSLTHALKVTIPTGHNLLDEEVKTLTISFPDGVNIVGNVALSMSATSTAPVLSTTGASNVVTLDLSSNPIDEGDTVWVFINPVSSVTGDIKFRGISVTDEVSYYYDIPVSSMNFAAGYITPVNAEIGEPLPTTTINLNITDNNLGEDLNSITITAPSGGVFKDGTTTKTITTTGVGTYSISYITEFYGDYFKGNDISVEYNSEHALITESFTLSSITDDVVNTISSTVPYLFEEYFNVTSDFSKHDDEDLGWSSDSSYSTVTDLGSYGMTGWTAHRVGGSKSGGSIRICGRDEAGASYDGYIISPALTNIKSGKTANLIVTYKYSGGEDEWNWLTAKNGNPRYRDGIDGSLGSWASQGTSGSYTSITQDGTIEITSGSNTTKLRWESGDDNTGSGANRNGNYWLYLDNVKVQIAN